MTDTDRTTPNERFLQVTREDGEQKPVRLLEGELFVCKGCCCGNVERGHPAVPLELFKTEWKARGIRKRVHLTITGCIGPCSVRNVVLLLYQDVLIWLHSINSDEDVLAIYDYIERLLASGHFELPTGRLASKRFERYLVDRSADND